MEVHSTPTSLEFKGTFRKPKKGEHNRRVWQSGPESWNAACTCGFSLVDTTEEAARAAAFSHESPGYTPPVRKERLMTSKGEVIEVTMSDAEAAQYLSKASSRFARDLFSSFTTYKGWTAGQRPWAHKLANEQKARQEAPKVEAAPSVTFPNIAAMMRAARSHLKHPKARVTINAAEVMFALGRDGSIYVSDGGPWEGRTNYGKITADTAAWIAYKTSKSFPSLGAGLAEVEKDPEAAMKAYGQRFGNCSACGRELTNAESIELGIGPICRERFFG